MVLEVLPESVLGVRNKQQGNLTFVEVLIKWQHLTATEATWEPFDDIAARFPEFHLEDKVKLVAGGIARDNPKPPVVITYARKKHGKVSKTN